MNIAVHPIVSEEVGLPCVVYGIGVQKEQCHIVRKEGYKFHQIIFSIKGMGVLKINGKEQKIPEGSYFYLKANEAHEYYKETTIWETQWIMFSGENIEKILSQLMLSESKVCCNPSNANIRKIYQDMMGELKSSDPFKSYVASCHLYKLLIELYRHSMEEACEDKARDSDIIAPVIQYINSHFSEAIELETLAQIANMTPQHLCKVFKQKLLMRPFEYITRCRMQEAKKLLSSSQMPIKEIARSVGYWDNSYFCATFKKYESMSPSAFRGSL